jgi:hypothetical protein
MRRHHLQILSGEREGRRESRLDGETEERGGQREREWKRGGDGMV